MTAQAKFSPRKKPYAAPKLTTLGAGNIDALEVNLEIKQALREMAKEGGKKQDGKIDV